MKKRSILVSIAAISAMSLSFAACDFDIKSLFGGKEQEHTHTFSEVWSKDETNHWHAATCTDTEDCASQTSDLAEHTYTDGECTVCGYEQAVTPPPDVPVEPDDPEIPDEPVEGSEENPIALTVPGSVTLNYTPNEDSDPVWYTFTAAADATLGVKLSDNAVMGYGVDKANMTYSTTNYVEVEIAAGTVYYVNLSTTDFSAGEITASAEYVVEQGIGDLTGTYNLINEWDQLLVVGVVSNDDNLGGTATFTYDGRNGTIVLNFTYEVVEDAIVLYNEEGEPTGDYGAQLYVTDGVISGAYNNGYDYELYVPKAPSGFEGKYDAVNDTNKLLVTITPETICIEMYYDTWGGYDYYGESEYTVVDGVPVVEGELSTVTFGVTDGVIISLTESELGTFTVSVHKDPTGFEGEYTFENNFGELAEVVVTTDDITVTAHDETFTSTYTVEDGEIVVDPEGDFVDFIEITVVYGEITGINLAGEEFGPVKGSSDNPIVITLSESDTQAAKVEAYKPIYYTFTATETGILTVTYLATDKVYAYITGSDYSYQEGCVQSFGLEIVSGVSYTLVLGVNEDIESAKPTTPVTLSFNAQALPVEGDFEKAYEVSETYEGYDMVCEFPETEDTEKYVWYKFVNYYGGNVIVTFRSNVNVKHGESKDALTALSDVAELRFTAQANDVPYYFGIQTKDLAAGQVEFAVNHILPQGMSEENPYALDNGTTAFSYAGNWAMHIYAYTPFFDGTATIKIADIAANIYTSDNAISTMAYMNTPKPIELKADQTIYISLAYQEDAVSGSITVDFARKIVLTGFEGEYTATTEDTAAMVTTYDVTVDSTQIIVSFTARETLQTNSYEYRLVEGVPTIVGDYIDYTFTVADGKFATMVDQGGIVYTLAPTIPEGAEGNPIDLTFDADSTGDLSVGGAYGGTGYVYYEITPSVSGTFTITVTNSENAIVVIGDKAETTTHMVAGTTYKVSLGMVSEEEGSSIPTATYTFVKDEVVSVEIQYGTYTTTSGYTVIIDESTINITYKNIYTGINSSRVSNSAYEVNMQDKKISILTGKPSWYLVFDENGLLTVLNDGSDRALTKSE